MRGLVVGLTGQTGAGKSTISEYARTLGCAVLDADKVAGEALTRGSDCLKRLAEIFGCDIIDSAGLCRRKVLAERAFASRENTDLLNSITHPHIIDRCREYIEELMHKDYDVILFDAPQLFESGGDKLCDFVIAVTADKDIRLDRIIKRDNLSMKDALLRINAQHDEEYYTGHSDYIIDGGKPVGLVREDFRKILYDIKKFLRDGGALGEKKS